MGESVQGISVVVPVGWRPEYKLYLSECLDSIRNQMQEGDEIVIVDDMANLSENNEWFRAWRPTVEQYICNPWLLGCAASWNIGVARAKNEWCILMGSDDRLLPGCIDACREKISHKPDPYGFYNLTCVDDQGEQFDWFNNAAMVSKTLWKATKGFPLESTIGAPDALLISCLLRHASQHLHQLRQGTPLYWVRTGEHQDTRRTGIYNWESISVRDKVTANFKWEENH